MITKQTGERFVEWKKTNNFKTEVLHCNCDEYSKTKVIPAWNLEYKWLDQAKQGPIGRYHIEFDRINDKKLIRVNIMLGSDRQY